MLDGPTSPTERWIERVRPIVPWLSLATGLVGALLMERGPREGKIVAAASVGVWIVLVAMHRLRRFERPSYEPSEGRRVARWLVRAASLGSLFATQSLVQLALFFAVPFYWQAATLDAGHVLFLVLFGVLCAVSLWDPWTEWLLTRLGLSALLPALATFVALNAVLPGLGISTQVSLWTSACLAALGVPIIGTAGVRPEHRVRVALVSLVAGALLPILLALGGARIVPAAPLRLVRAEMGTARSGKWILAPVEDLDRAPAQLICATAIESPFGLHDRLFHVWRKDGELRARVELDIVGGRKQGYRTQSRIRHFGHDPTGTYRCTVETATGQVLGSRSVRIRG